MRSILNSRIALPAACIGGLILFFVYLLDLLAGTGWFYSLGLDYAIYGATSEVVTGSGWSAFYDEVAITRAFNRWLAHGPAYTGAWPYVVSPYPAAFLLPIFATDRLGHMGGFAAWTAINLGLYAAVVRGLTRGSGTHGPAPGPAQASGAEATSPRRSASLRHSR